MDEYEVKLSPRAARDIDGVYSYIAEELKVPSIAEEMADSLADAINSLNQMPYRGAERKTGAFANSGYRQLFVKNFTVVYRIDETRKMVIIVTVRYTPSNF